MTYPEGTRFLAYFYYLDNGKWRIRRHIVLPDGKKTSAHLEYKAYSHLTTEEEIKAYVLRLNHKDQRDEKAKRAIEIKTAFIPIIYLEEFKERIEAEVPNTKDANYLQRLLHSRCLDVFVNQYRLPDPASWAENQTKWAGYLINSGLSAKSIRSIVQISNRFLEFLHQKNPREIPYIKLKPISKARFKEIDASRKLDADAHPGLYIKDADYALIQKASPDILPHIELMYHYGLRRAESLAVRPGDVREGYLSVERQLRSKGIIAPLKGRSSRKTPHWMCTPEQTYEWAQAVSIKQLHPDTLYTKWTRLMLELSLPYQLHDLRRTFVTQALDKRVPKDVQLAVGHTSIMTTMKYLRDNRELKDRPFQPIRTINKEGLG